MFTYKSHHESSTRAFDHLYDPNFISNQVKIHHLNCKSIYETAPIHIIPCFYSMFSEIRRNKFCFPQRNGLPYNSEDCGPKNIDKKPINYNLFSMPSNVPVEENLYRFEPKCLLPKMTKHDKVSQTIFRETEIQTEPYLPHPKLKIGETKIPEILYVKCDEEPNLKDIEKIERDAIRRKWEENLRQLPLSLEEKVKQMKFFEIRDQLLREKELHEVQEKRMDYVINALNQRDVAVKLKCRDKILNVYKAASEMDIKERAKIEVKNERKLRQLSRINMASKTKYQIPYTLKSSKSLDFGQFNVFDCPKNHQFDFNLNNNRDALWVPKQKAKVVRHCMNKEKTRNDIYKEIKKHNDEFDKNIEYQFRRPKCLQNKPIDKVYECSVEDEEPLDHIMIQKTIKGKITQKSLKSGMKKEIKEIHKLRNLYPIRCITDLFDGENFMPFEDISQASSASWFSKDIITDYTQNESHSEPEAENSSKITEINCDLQNTITEVLQQALLIAQDTINRKILREANELRLKREELAQIEALKQKLNKMREELTKNRTDQFYKDLTAEVIELVVPLVIEDISEKEAIEFIIKKAAEVSADACNKNITNKAKIERFIKDILIPHIESKSDGIDDHLIALFGSRDAFNCFIDKCFSTDQ